MTVLSEAEILNRHDQALGEAHRACQHLGRHADKDFVGLRGGDYVALKAALEVLEGSARQLAHYRSDARWLRLGTVYAKLLRASHTSFLLERWKDFTAMMGMFDRGRQSLDELANRRTGRTMKQGPILPSIGNTDWLRMPDYAPAWPRPRVLN